MYVIRFSSISRVGRSGRLDRVRNSYPRLHQETYTTFRMQKCKPYKSSIVSKSVVDLVRTQWHYCLSNEGLIKSSRPYSHTFMQMPAVWTMLFVPQANIPIRTSTSILNCYIHIQKVFVSRTTVSSRSDGVLRDSLNHAPVLLSTFSVNYFATVGPKVLRIKHV